MRLRRWSVATTAVTLAVSLLVACSSKATTEPRRPLDTRPAAQGSVVVSDDAEGYAVSLPPSWVKLPTDTGSFDAAAKQVLDKASLAARPAVTLGLVQLRSAVRTGVIVAAIDPDSGATANLVTLGANGQKVSEVAVGAANRLIGNGATDLTREKVTVDEIAAERSRFKNKFSSETGPVDLSESQLYVVRRGQAFILTLTGESADLDGIASSLKLA